MSDGSEFQVRGAATENAVLGTVSSGASDDRRGWTGTAIWIRSLMYAGVVEDNVLNVSDAILYVTQYLTGSQWSDLRSGLASVGPPRWQTTLAKLFCSTKSLSLVVVGHFKIVVNCWVFTVINVYCTWGHSIAWFCLYCRLCRGCQLCHYAVIRGVHGFRIDVDNQVTSVYCHYDATLHMHIFRHRVYHCVLLMFYFG